MADTPEPTLKKASADADFTKGAHPVCEDYAFATVLPLGDRQLYCAVLSDGCSSSVHTDVGARVLSFALVRAFRMAFETNAVNPEFVEGMVLAGAESTIATMGLTHHALAATLLGVATDGDKLAVFCWGDGFVAVNGQPVTRLEYTANVPYYLSYKLDAQANADFGAVDETLAIERGEAIAKVAANTHPSWQYVATLVPGQDVLVTLMSDGAGSFVKGRELVPWQDTAPLLLDYANASGSFVKRQFRYAMRECGKRGWVNADDVSMAAVSLQYGEAQ